MSGMVGSLLAPRFSLFEGRVAVVHDWLTGMRGGEKVLEAILELFPSADLYTLFHRPGSVSAEIEKHPIHTSSLQKWASRVDDYRKLLPLYPRAIAEFDLSGYDLVFSSSHCVAKGVRAQRHICYCHTPMRYVWDRFDDYFPRSRPFRRLAGKVIAARLRRWDRRTASHVDHFLANSAFVRDRIRRYYERDATVIHPFIAAAFLQKPIRKERDDFHLVVSALVPYKRLDIAIDAMNPASRLVIIGEGPMRQDLEKRAKGRAEFAGSLSQEQLISYLSRARSLILPGVEDFGITPLEAMALGTPVVAFRAGGALETVVEGFTGVFFDEQNSGSLAAALREAERRPWNREEMHRHAAKFSKGRFQAQFGEFLGTVMTSRRVAQNA